MCACSCPKRSLTTAEALSYCILTGRLYSKQACIIIMQLEGHGDLYPAMLGSGTLDNLLAKGVKSSCIACMPLGHTEYGHFGLARSFRSGESSTLLHSLANVKSTHVRWLYMHTYRTRDTLKLRCSSPWHSFLQK